MTRNIVLGNQRFSQAILMALMVLIGFVGAVSAAQSDARRFPGPGQIMVNGQIMLNLQQAFDSVPRDGYVLLGDGVFKMSGVLKMDGVSIVGSNDTWLDGVAKDGKAAITIKATDVTIDHIKCRNIIVPSKNGSCVRHEGGRLFIRNVHFKDSEQGLLAWGNSEYILVEDSIFENLGKAGRAHGMYVNGGELIVRRSQILGSKDQGHGIKSRADKTLIERNVIASLDGDDSRLIDIADGGDAIVRDNLLVEGHNTVNWQIISFAVEKEKPNSRLTMTGNVIITDREGGSEFLLTHNQKLPISMQRNVVIGRVLYQPEETVWPEGNFLYKSREEFGLPPAPELPKMNFR